MILYETLEHDARRIYDEEAARVTRRRDADELQVCPLRFMLRELLMLLAERPDPPVDELRPLVRRLVLERNFMDCGDACGASTRHTALDHHVDLALRVLARVRQLAEQRGERCHLPAAPLMCG